MKTKLLRRLREEARRVIQLEEFSHYGYRDHAWGDKMEYKSLVFVGDELHLEIYPNLCATASGVLATRREYVYRKVAKMRNKKHHAIKL